MINNAKENNTSYLKDFVSIDKSQLYAWSPWLEAMFGYNAALLFAVGSDLFSDKISEDLSEMQFGELEPYSLLKDVPASWTIDDLPEVFRDRYDVNFLRNMYSVLCEMRVKAFNGECMEPNSVMEELVFMLCVDEGVCNLIDLWGIPNKNDLKDWVFDLFGDSDIIFLLYSDMSFLSEDEECTYNFDHWADNFRPNKE